MEEDFLPRPTVGLRDGLVDGRVVVDVLHDLLDGIVGPVEVLPERREEFLRSDLLAHLHREPVHDEHIYLRAVQPSLRDINTPLVLVELLPVLVV